MCSANLIDLTHSKAELNEILKLYQINLATQMVGYNTLKNYLEWFNKAPNLKYTKIYAYGNYRLSGLYMIVDRYHIMIHSLIPNDIDLGAALKLLDWTRGYKIYALSSEHLDIVLNTLKEIQVPYNQAHLYVYELEKSEALQMQLNCPPQFTLRALNSAVDTSLVDSLWPPRQPGSVHFMRRVIALNPSLGLYNENNELIAWCTICQSGFLGSLYVLEAYRRQGLATLIIAHFVHSLASSDHIVYTSINSQNSASIAFFEKLNFIKKSEIFHLRAYRVPVAEVWVED